ncbi:FadR family transcriptional regulator [Cutibacterium sp. WCA-380-WT-3A]|uniref:FadR family transcriptional regulator n=1 Tax=Cutibacterium porci TaxID=2605781 RepID=A0A7K0J7A0_9ACTN|nr:FCD domain-containing protein [Cutibacterium porci]MSS45846.1 FadR family transcriptional regulator [Cutibacterium porci]
MLDASMATTVSHVLGARIVSGALPPGTVMRLEELDSEFGVSRSVTREAVKLLEALHIVRARRRIGIVVTEESEWDVSSPAVIEWFLSGPRRDEVIAWISELRSAVEPLAAELAAQRATRHQTTTLALAVTGMIAAAADRDLDEYLRWDINFHTVLLHASHNPLVASHVKIVSAVLEGRTHLMPFEPKQEAIGFHRSVADAVAGHDADAAAAAMRQIVTEAHQAMSSSSNQNGVK